MPKFATFPLIKQLIWPLLILVPVFAFVTIMGSTLFLYESLSASVDAQLDQAQQSAYHDLKEKELQLTNLLIRLGQQPTSDRLATLETEARTYYPHLDLHLYDSRSQPGESLRKLLRSAGREKARTQQITYDSRTGHCFISFVEPSTAPRGALLLQFPLSQKLMKGLSDRYRSSFSLYSEKGQLIASSRQYNRPIPQLSSILLSRIENRGHIYTSKIGGIDYRQIYTPLPLGRNGMLYLATGRPLDTLNGLLVAHGLRLLLTVVLTIVIGGIIYYRRLLQIIAPLNNLLNTIHQVAQGNLSSRVEMAEKDQLRRLGDSFNQMLGQLENLYENRLTAKKNAALAQEALKYNAHLKKKNLKIEKTNIRLKERYEELSALFKISRSLTSALDQDLLFNKIFNVFREVLHCQRIVLLLYHYGSESLEVIKTTGLDSTTNDGLSFKLGEGISGTVAATMQPIYSADLDVDARNLSYKGRWVTSGSLLSLPMVVQNHLIGVLNLHSTQKDAFNSVSRQLAQAVADQAAISIENSRLYEKTRALSVTDELTELANRRHFQELLQREWAQSKRYNSNFSLLMVDIDNFKNYNDKHGHLKGDIVLKKVAALLLQNTRGIDLVARFGGEEFILLLPKANKDASLAVAVKLCQCIEKEYFSGMEKSQPLKKLTISIGTATFPGDSINIYDLLNRADEALYQAKKQGRNCAVSWAPEMSPMEE